MAEYITRGLDPHYCHPPKEKFYVILPASLSASSKDERHEMEREPPVGTVWRCDCGTLWIVAKNPYRNVMKEGDWIRARWSTRLKYRGK